MGLKISNTCYNCKKEIDINPGKSISKLELIRKLIEKDDVVLCDYCIEMVIHGIEFITGMTNEI